MHTQASSKCVGGPSRPPVQHLGPAARLHAAEVNAAVPGGHRPPAHHARPDAGAWHAPLPSAQSGPMNDVVGASTWNKLSKNSHKLQYLQRASSTAGRHDQLAVSGDTQAAPDTGCGQPQHPHPCVRHVSEPHVNRHFLHPTHGFRARSAGAGGGALRRAVHGPEIPALGWPGSCASPSSSSATARGRQSRSAMAVPAAEVVAVGDRPQAASWPPQLSCLLLQLAVLGPDWIDHHAGPGLCMAFAAVSCSPGPLVRRTLQSLRSCGAGLAGRWRAAAPAVSVQHQGFVKPDLPYAPPAGLAALEHHVAQPSPLHGLRPHRRVPGG